MIRAAGILFLVGETALFLRRGNGSATPNCFGIPGGKLEGDETAEDAAIRETLEETGVEVDPKDLRLWTRTITPAQGGEPAIEGDVPAEPEDVDWTTFLCKMPEQFMPALDLTEHDGFAWAPVGGAPEPIHPGVRIALERLTMDELGVARAMAAGRLASPQRYENVWLFAIRITGTGVAYRHGRKEFCWRDPSIYMTEDFLARCNGLDVIYEHPEKALLNHDEFHDRKVGAIFLPYFHPDKPDEVWGIAKIRDDDVAKEMRENPMSTSPAVNFADPTVNERIQLEDGKVMLVEGKPSLLDHVAICPVGVWDKGGAPTGVESADLQFEGMVADAEWNEGDHPRAKDGKFGSGGGLPKQTDYKTVKIKKVNLRQVRDELDNGGSDLFVRWSNGPKYDLDPNSNSKDYQTGEIHSGISSKRLESSDSHTDFVNSLDEYSYFQMPGVKPHIYKGKKIGTDSDGAPSIRASEYLGTLSPDEISNVVKNGSNALRAYRDAKMYKNALGNQPDAAKATRDYWKKSLEKATDTIKKLSPEERDAASLLIDVSDYENAGSETDSAPAIKISDNSLLQFTALTAAAFAMKAQARSFAHQ